MKSMPVKNENNLVKVTGEQLVQNAGETMLDLPDGSGRACSISSMTGALIAQMLTAETIRLLYEHGKAAPVYVSSNVPAGIEHNQKLVKHYGHRICPV